MKKLYLDIKEDLVELLEKEKIVPTDNFLNIFLKFLSKVTNYEEEENKIKPKIILSTDVHRIIKTLSPRYILSISKEGINGENFEKRMKTLLPFCNLGWYVYINIGKTDIEYGLVRTFTGPKGLSLTETFLSSEFAEEDTLIDIVVTNNSEIVIGGIRKNKLLIDFKLFDDSSFESSNITFNKLVTDMVSEIEEPENKDKLFQVFRKLFNLVHQRVHGTILLVVNSQFAPNTYLEDGVWLDNPIDLSESALNCIGDARDIYLSELHYSLTGLFLEMMNIDGITVVDCCGRIVAYNVFLKQSFIEDSNVTGGARKRTALSLLKVEDENIMGVYFQSQDGHNFYEGKYGDE
ncbi:hypothetical protein [Peribacillus butanolivorans]